VLVDLFYDHFLAVQWNEYADVPLQPFLSWAHGIVLEYEENLPERLRCVVPVIFAELLPSYLEVKGIERALQRMSTRIARPNRLGEGGAELLRHYQGLNGDFREFLPELQGFVREETSSRAKSAMP
jgi:acyl carrier protein phosphodiesterase